MAAGDRKTYRWLKAALLAGAAMCALMPASALPVRAQEVADVPSPRVQRERCGAGDEAFVKETAAEMQTLSFDRKLVVILGMETRFCLRKVSVQPMLLTASPAESRRLDEGC